MASAYLQLSALKALPPPLRRLAEAACTCDADIARPDRALADLAELEEASLRRVKCALVAIRVLCFTKSLPAATAEPLCLRLYLWLIFLDAHWTQLPHIAESWLPFFLRTVPFTIVLFLQMGMTLVDRYPVLPLLGKIWITIPPDTVLPDLNDVHELIVLAKLNDNTRLASFIDGAGSPAVVAKHLTATIRVLLTEFPFHRRAPPPVNKFTRMLRMFGQERPGSRAGAAASAALFAALHRRKLAFIPLILRVLDVIMTFYPEVSAVAAGLIVLANMFRHPSSTPAHFIDAMNSGLLTTLVKIGAWAGADEYGPGRTVVPLVREFFIDTISFQLTHYRSAKSVIAALDKAKKEGHPEEDLDDTRLEGDWMVFSYGTVPSSARTMEETTPRKSACSNLQCLNITPNNVAKRCSGCKVLHYCSKDCQRIDWKEGNHRAFCDMYGLSRNFFTSPFHQFSKKQRTWLWKIAHTLFRDRTKYTLNQHIEFFSRFNLSSAPPQAITLVGPKTLRNTIGEPNGTFVMQATALSAVDSPLAVSLRSAGKDWVDLVSRADKSKGRMNLCVLSIREAGEMVNLVYPVYSSWNIRAVALRLAALKQQGVDGKAFEEALNAELKAVGRKAGDALIPDVEYPLLSGA